MEGRAMKLGFLYAGQGSQHPGMGADLYEEYPAFRQVYHASEVAFDLCQVSFQDPEGLLNQTRYTQPCMVAFAAGLTAVLRELGIVPAAAAGLSLGEYSALHAAGVFDARTAVELAAFRGSAMERAAAGVESAMMAVLGLDRDALSAACRQASAVGTVVIANYNCPGQLVIGGEKAAVELAAELAKRAGARRCLPLKVSGPFHTPLMAPAGAELAERFAAMTFHEPRIPVVFNCLGDVNAGQEPIPELLVRQVQSSVYMEDSLRSLARLGVDALVEIGPGKVLSGFARKTVPELPVLTVETAEEVKKLPELLRQLEKELHL
jgi:[acyl-carrier-protein] S-malonyltransferase